MGIIITLELHIIRHGKDKITGKENSHTSLDTSYLHLLTMVNVYAIMASKQCACALLDPYQPWTPNHDSGLSYRCHFGPCPAACAGPCGTPLPCGHVCASATCHDETPPPVGPFRPPQPPIAPGFVYARKAQMPLSPVPAALQVLLLHFLSAKKRRYV